MYLFPTRVSQEALAQISRIGPQNARGLLKPISDACLLTVGYLEVSGGAVTVNSYCGSR